MSSIISTQSLNSVPVDSGSTLSARATSLFPWPSKHFTLQLPRISAKPSCASLRVAKIYEAAGCKGCVVGTGSVRRNWTTGERVGSKDKGNEQSMDSDPGAGVAPEDPSAMTCV
jgi:hypothetical protein